MDLFSPSGINAWKDRLNHSPRFRDAASSWQGQLLLIELADTGANRSAWVVVRDGHCLEARMGHPADEASADYVLAASSDTWSDLVAARHTPAAAALAGGLKLIKGNIMSLIPHAGAAAALLAALAGETS